MSPKLLNELYRYSFALTGNENDAYDLLQSSIEKHLSSNSRKISNESSYLKKIIKNKYIDSYRRTQRYSHEAFDEVVTQVDLDTKPLEQIIVSQDQLEYLWHKLKDDERELLYFWAVEGFSTSELSHHLGIPRGTLLSKIHRLRSRLEQYSDNSTRQGTV